MRLGVGLAERNCGDGLRRSVIRGGYWRGKRQGNLECPIGLIEHLHLVRPDRSNDDFSSSGTAWATEGQSGEGVPSAGAPSQRRLAQVQSTETRAGEDQAGCWVAHRRCSRRSGSGRRHCVRQKARRGACGRRMWLWWLTRSTSLTLCLSLP